MSLPLDNKIGIMGVDLNEHCCLLVGASQIMESSVLSLIERSLRTLPFIPLLLQSLEDMEDWPFSVGVQRRGSRTSTSDSNGLNKASLYPPQRSPHPNYMPDTSTLLQFLFFLTPYPCNSSFSSSSDHASPFAWAQSPRGLHNTRVLLVDFASQSAA